MQGGAVEGLVRGFLSQPDKESEDRYLEEVASTRRYARTGSTVPALDYAAKWRVGFNLFLHYPVDRIITRSRDDMYDGKYDVEYVPLNDWNCNMGWDVFMGGAYEIAQVKEIRKSESKVWIWARRVNGDREELCEPPHPLLPDPTGMMVARPHGAVLHFEERPPQFVNTPALRRYLEFRGVTLKRDHPREEATVQAHPESLNPELLAITYTYRGVMEMLTEMLCSDRNGQPMTQDEYEQMGIADPIPWEYTSPTEHMLNGNFKEVAKPPVHHTPPSPSAIPVHLTPPSPGSQGVRGFQRGQDNALVRREQRQQVRVPCHMHDSPIVKNKCVFSDIPLNDAGGVPKNFSKTDTWICIRSESGTDDF